MSANIMTFSTMGKSQIHVGGQSMTSGSLEGQMLGKYRVLDSLGRGGMARVYRAYHPRLDRYVAIKVLRPDLIEDAEFLARFQREARAVASLRHPNIVQVHDFDVQDDIYYMVMELMEGDTLKTRLSDYRIRGEQMEWGEMVRIMLDVLDGLAYAHSEGMIHRDIKPANILLSRRGQAVLGDFGIAHIVGSTRYTAAGMLIGTLEYIAPEQGMEGRCDVRSDLYSLGIVFYEMLTYQVPFDADTPLAILMKHIHDPLPLPRQLNPNIPEAFERVVLKSLAKRADDRYQSAEEMAQALRVAAQEAGLSLPSRVSLPLSFTTSDAPAEPVAVISGSTRKIFTDVGFAEEETDIRLGQRLTEERIAQEQPVTQETERDSALADASKELLGAMGTIAQVALNRTTDALRQVAESAEGVATQVGANVELAVNQIGQPEVVVKRGHVGKSFLMALGSIAFGNLLMLTIAFVTQRWSIYDNGWPIELFLVVLGLSFIMHAAAAIWLVIPIGLIGGTGVLLTYSALTRNWEVWEILWFFLIWIAAGSVVLPIFLSKRADRARPLSRQLAWLAGGGAIAISLFIAFVVTLGPLAIVLAGIFLVLWAARARKQRKRRVRS
ncbi:MAG: protein kinase [Anaerolineae bacterium]|nr:protein kinase [Anaerolineae bacterium]